MRKISLAFLISFLFCSQAFAVLPTVFATYPSGNVPASLLDANFTFLEKQGVQGLTTTGTSNAYVATPADAWVTGYAQYVARALTVIPNFTNTSSSTINVSSLGAASIYKNVSGVQTAIAAGDMVSGTPAILICDGTGFLLANPTAATASGVKSVKRVVVTATGTFTPDAGLLYADVRVIASGGGGGGVDTTSGASAGGGAAGAEGDAVLSAATIGASKAVTIGAGGTAGANTGGTGGTGGTTSFGSIISCSGGLGGVGSTGNASAGGAGQTCTGGDFNGTGAPGGAGTDGNATPQSFSGAGGSSALGGGGVGLSTTAGNGVNGATNTGGGGGGALGVGSGTARTGGVGGTGIIIITEYLSQ